ncbi:MAG: HPF/RaiA family ribosome-associated protein [bacterium]|nr:HPF/RaiA family ribosome-associated protein [bacterium]
MSINIMTTNVDLTPEIDSYLTKKLESLKHIIDFDADNAFAQVELAKTTNHHQSGEIFRSEINYRCGALDGRVVSEKEDLLTAIDAMKDQLMRDVTTTQQKNRDLRREGGAEIKDMLRMEETTDNK